MIRCPAGRGVLIIDGLYQTGDDYDDGSNPRLECKRCLGEFLLPEGVEIDSERCESFLPH